MIFTIEKAFKFAESQSGRTKGYVEPLLGAHSRDIQKVPVRRSGFWCLNNKGWAPRYK